MNTKILKSFAASIVAAASLCAFGIEVGSKVPGSDHSSDPCTPKQRTDDYHTSHFNEDIRGSQGKDFDAVMFGDSITDFWNSNPNLSLDGDPVNTRTFNMGIGSDRVQNLLWRLRNGALDGYTTKYFTLMVGINNGHQKCIDHNDHADRPEDVAESIRLMLCEMATKHPDAKILLMPIIPYSFDSKYFAASEVTVMSEAVNDYILQFVDNKRVFWVDLRSQYLKRDSMPNKECYREGGRGGYDAVGLCLHPEFFTYSNFWRPALTNAMHRYLSVDAGEPHVADPSLGYAKAAPNADGAGSATITVFGINLGTYADASAVTTYSIDYELDGGAKTRALTGHAGVRASFVIPNVALGDHTCKVTVTTADGKELVTLLDFKMTEPWYANPLPADESAVRTDGSLAYAYAPSANTVSGVSFAKANGSIDDSNIKWPYSSTSPTTAPDGVASGSYRDLLSHCWWANQGPKEVTLRNLTPGHAYLVQIFGYRNSNDSKAHVWIKESYWDPNFIKVFGDGWARGGELTGTFTATEADKTFTIESDGNYAINGIQVRDLGESGAPVVVQPRIKSVLVTTNETAATFFLSGIVMGTDDAGTDATSYSVSYSLNNAAAVTALQGQAADTASFGIEGLADGEYTCVVTITTDKNKTSAEKSVSFRIGPPPPQVVAPFIGSASVTTNGTTATIALGEIVIGTDGEGAPASSYSVSYSLANAPAVTVLSGQTGATASFDIADLADGSYKCVVTVTTDRGRTAETTVNFRIGELPPTPTGWTVGPMSSDGSTVRTDGDLLYAYSVLGGTVGGVTFTRAALLADAAMVVASPNAKGSKFGDFGVPAGMPSGDFATMLSHGWYWEGADGELSFDLTLKGLTAGKAYLVQLVSHRTSGSTLVSANGSAPVYIHGSHDDVDYTYGGSIVGIFVATEATATFTVTYSEGSSGMRPLNAVQVRYLGEGGGVAMVVAPSIGSATVMTNGTTATISLSGVAMGTDDEGTNATSYAVSYSLTNAPAVTVLQNQTGATASFDIADLADGEYTCEVTVTTDKNKTATKSVSFSIGTSGQGGGDPVVPAADGWTAVAMGATGSSIRTDGTLKYAYARGDYTVNGVAFAGVGDSVVSNADCVVWEGSTGAQTVPSTAPSDTETGDYKSLLSHAWWANPKGRKIALNNLEDGKRYLVQIIAFRDTYTTQFAVSPDGTQTNKFGGAGWEYGGSLIGVFTATGTSKEFIIEYVGNACINAIQVRELPASEPVDVDAPVIGGAGVDVPFAVSSDKVTITIGNAATGHTYGYRKSTTLAGLAAAEVVWQESPVQSAGVLAIEIAKDPDEPACFYQIVVE